MEKAHEYFRRRGYGFSLLGTRQVLVAHEWYKRLGYEHLTDCESAYKILKKSSKSALSPITGKIDFQKMAGSFNEFSRGKTGMVVRDDSYLRTLLKVEEIRPKQCIVNEEGYVVFREDKSLIFVRELIALNNSQADRLIALLEQRSKSIICDRVILDKRLVKAYASRDYMISGNHGVVMAKPLSADSSVKETYGSDFFMSGLDGL
jgi:predicted acetyltransferase